jgi:hypothetical protein
VLAAVPGRFLAPFSAAEPMPRDGAIIFADLIGQLDVLRPNDHCGVRCPDLPRLM